MIAKAKTGRSVRKHGFYCDNRKDQYSRGEGRGQWRIQTFTDGGANHEFGLSMLCLGISYCGKPIRVRPHRFTGHGIIQEKPFSVIKGKVWLLQAIFFP